MIILLVIATEAVTEIVVASEFPVFYWIRTTLGNRALPDTPRNDLKQRLVVSLYKLITCGYCFSVWVAGFFALFSPNFIGNSCVNWLCMTFVIHRLSNWLHVVTQLVWKGRVVSQDHEVSLRIKNQDDEDVDLNSILEG